MPTIVAGDFNGEVDEPFYDLLRQAGFQSAYRDLMNGQEPNFTTWKFKAREQRHEKEESRTIDYIFYRSNGQLEPIAYLELPSDRTEWSSIGELSVGSFSSSNDISFESVVKQ